MMGGGFFDDDDNDFFGGNRGFTGMQMNMQGGGGFGNMGGFSSFSSSSFSGGGPGSQSIKTQTFMEDGKRVTRTEKTTTDRSG